MAMPVQVHRMFFHFTELPLSMRTLFSATLVVLGIGYLFAMIQIYESHAGRDGKRGLSAEDIAIAYSGSPVTRLEAALSGPMSGMLPADERAVIIASLHKGLDQVEFEAHVRPIVDQRCLSCHGGSNPHIPNLKGFENLSKVTEMDTGMTIASLIRVSHIHMFGITFIFFLMGLIFSHAYLRPVWLKSVVVLLPFLAIVIDIGSWYLTKIDTAFAWAVIIGGVMMGLSFAFQWIVSMYQLWFYKYSTAEHPKEIVG
jgi:hypothetical protein